MSKGSNRKNLGKQIGQVIPTDVPMTLHATTKAPVVDARCFTCQQPIERGQRVRWCEVVGFVPAGWIHATHFEAGTSARRAPTQRPSRPCRRHQWSAWRRAGIFDPTEVSRCSRCPATKTRRAVSRSEASLPRTTVVGDGSDPCLGDTVVSITSAGADAGAGS